MPAQSLYIFHNFNTKHVGVHQKLQAGREKKYTELHPSWKMEIVCYDTRQPIPT